MILSIITICYNDKNLVKTCESIINQSWQDFEWIVIDGGSNDEIQNLWNKYKRRINTFVSEKDNGIYDAYNKGLRLAKGEYLLFLNSGDCLHDKNVLKDIFKDKQYSSDVLYGDIKYIKNNLFKTGKIVKPSNEISNTFFINDNICTPATFIKRDLFDKCGEFDLQYRIISDLDRWVVFEQNGASFQKLNRVVSNFYATGISTNKKNRAMELQERNHMYLSHYSKEFYEDNVRNYKRKLKPLQRLFSMVNTSDGKYKEIRIFNKLFVVEKK